MEKQLGKDSSASNARKVVYNKYGSFYSEEDKSLKKSKKKTRASKSPLGLFYNAWFRGSTDCSIIDDAYNESMRRFILISSSSEVSVYKIMHHFYEEFNLQEAQIKTIDGAAIESYLKLGDPIGNSKQIQLLFRTLLNKIRGKWVVIPNMSNVWDAETVYLLYNELRIAKAIGLVFHAERSIENNFAQVLFEDTRLQAIQFPERVYTKSSEVIDDGY